MSDNQSKQALYDRIRSSSRDAVVLHEMKRLGFWDSGEGSTVVPEALITREAELRKELNGLLAKQKRWENRDKALHDMRKARLLESRKKQKENKEKREAERIVRAEVWAARKQEEILYLGEDVSSELGKLKGEDERLYKQSLIPFTNHAKLATAMRISVSELRFLAFNRKVSKTSHYRRFLMPKKRGGHRLISAPMPRLKSAQHWILAHILSDLQIHPAAHGFRPEHSILSNANPHVDRELVINLDLKDFFPSVTYPRVLGVFRSLGYSPSVATVLALICTEAAVDEKQLDGESWYLATSVRHLPQGAPTSPAITNLLCRRMDARLQGIARKHDYRYTRYADDLTFSGKRGNERKLLWHVKKVIKEEGFTIHPDKLRIMGHARRQEVTGLVVNKRSAIPRSDVRAFRALLHRISTKGLDDASWRGSEKRILARMSGFASYLHMIDPERHSALITQARGLEKQFNFQPEIRHPKKPDPQQPPPIPRPQKQSLWSKVKGIFKSS